MRGSLVYGTRSPVTTRTLFSGKAHSVIRNHRRECLHQPHTPKRPDPREHKTTTSKIIHSYSKTCNSWRRLDIRNRCGQDNGDAQLETLQRCDDLPTSKPAHLHPKILASLSQARTDLNINDGKSWEHLLTRMAHKHGFDGVWAVFHLIQHEDRCFVLGSENSDKLRTEILIVALQNQSRLKILVNVAMQLLIVHKFQWPELHTKLLHACLSSRDYDAAVYWHLHTWRTFPPQQSAFEKLLSDFVTDPSPAMQRTLTSLYIFGSKRTFYDYIIPRLFISGNSTLARTWRKRLILFRDYPSSSDSAVFLNFIMAYYPSIRLSDEEIAITKLPLSRPISRSDDTTFSNIHLVHGHKHSDTIIARWFASSWMPVDFTINLVHQLGRRMIGPRSLQALALRENDAKGVADRIMQLQKLGVKIPLQTYSRALVFFARTDQNALLADLLHCDIHPDEFDDAQTRQMLLSVSARNGDWRTERLLQHIQWTIGIDFEVRHFNLFLFQKLDEQPLSRVWTALDRLEALRISMPQSSATALLRRIFTGVAKHYPQNRRQSRRVDGIDTPLDRAIDMVRRIACHNVAIPVFYWRYLLDALGRFGRLNELEQLSAEIVQLYSPPDGGLIAVHHQDSPRPNLAHSVQRENVSYLAKSKDTAAACSTSLSTVEAAIAADQDALNSSITHEGIKGSDSIQDIVDCETSILLREKLVYPVNDQNDHDSFLGYGYNASVSYIPADLPPSHREHPVQKIFDNAMQRAIIRWGFDQSLLTEPPTLPQGAMRETSDFDIARGVRLLAQLRDRGVLIDVQLVRAAVLARIAVSQMPGRRKNRTRDSYEMSSTNLKRLFEDAWGRSLLPNVEDMMIEVEAQKPRLWNRYSRLINRKNVVSQPSDPYNNRRSRRKYAEN